MLNKEDWCNLLSIYNLALHSMFRSFRMEVVSNVDFLRERRRSCSCGSMYLSQDASLGGCVTSKGSVAISSHPNGAAAAEGRNGPWPSKCMLAIRSMYQKAVLCLRNSAARWIGQLGRERRVKAINLNYGRRAVSTVAPRSTTPLQGCIKSRAGCHRAYQRATDGCTRASDRKA